MSCHNDAGKTACSVCGSPLNWDGCFDTRTGQLSAPKCTSGCKPFGDQAPDKEATMNPKIQRLRAICEAANPKPVWGRDLGGPSYCLAPEPPSIANQGRFNRTARTALPALLGAIEEIREQCKRASACKGEDGETMWPEDIRAIIDRALDSVEVGE